MASRARYAGQRFLSLQISRKDFIGGISENMSAFYESHTHLAENERPSSFLPKRYIFLCMKNIKRWKTHFQKL
jgi:hypothetical protein